MALRVGFIGAGANTRLRHIPGLVETGRVELAGAVNRSLPSSEAIVREFGMGRAYASIEELLADPAVDAVCIGTWPYKHFEYTAAALAAGKHVLCEARMAMDAAQAEEMWRAARARPNLVTQLVPAPFDFKLGPTITRLLREGALGEVVEVTVAVLNGSALDPAAPIHWRQRMDYSGRNIMMLGIYVEQMQRWFGDTVRVVADGRITVTERVDAETGHRRPVDVPDTFSVLARLASGPRLSYHVSNVSAGSPFNGVVVYGTKATLRWLPDDRATITPHGGAAADVVADPGTDRGWRVEADFVASVLDGAPVLLTNVDDGLRYMRFTDAAWTSWQEGRAVDIQPV